MSKQRRGSRKKQKGDPYEDLRELDTTVLKDMLSDSESNQRSLEQQTKSLRNERQTLISTVQVLRRALYESHTFSKERQDLLVIVRERFKQINEQQKIRDEINSRIPPSLDSIELLLRRTWNDLTQKRTDPTTGMSLSREIQKFSFLMELIECHKIKSEANAAHRKIGELWDVQRVDLDTLDRLREEAAKVASSAADENQRISVDNVSRKEEKELNDRIRIMKDNLDSMWLESKATKAEVRRLRAYLKIREIDERRGKKVMMRLDTLREHAADGGALSIHDMARLLKSGGISDLSGSSQAPKKKPKKGRKGRRVKVTAARGKATRRKKKE